MYINDYIQMYPKARVEHLRGKAESWNAWPGTDALSSLSNLAFGPDALESDYTPYSPHLLGLRLHHDPLQHGLLSSSPFSRQVSSSARLAHRRV